MRRAIEHRRTHGRDLCEYHEAQRPKPGQPHDRQEDTAFFARDAAHGNGVAHDVVAELELRIGGGDGRNKQRRQPADDRDGDHCDGQRDGCVLGRRGDDTADEQANDDGDVGATLDEAVGAHELIATHELGQDAVLDRPEQGGL